MKTKQETRQAIEAMAFDLAAINRATGNGAAYTLSLIQQDLFRIADGLVWGN